MQRCPYCAIPEAAQKALEGLAVPGAGAYSSELPWRRTRKLQISSRRGKQAIRERGREREGEREAESESASESDSESASVRVGG